MQDNPRRWTRTISHKPFDLLGVINFLYYKTIKT